MEKLKLREGMSFLRATQHLSVPDQNQSTRNGGVIRARRTLSSIISHELFLRPENQRRAYLGPALVECHAILWVMTLWLISSLDCVAREVRNSPLTSPPLWLSVDWVSGQSVPAGELVLCQEGMEMPLKKCLQRTCQGAPALPGWWRHLEKGFQDGGALTHLDTPRWE